LYETNAVQFSGRFPYALGTAQGIIRLQLPGGMTGLLGPKRQGRIVAEPYWARDTAVTHGQPWCPADNQTYSSSAVFGRDRAAGPYMACKGSGVQISSAPVEFAKVAAEDDAYDDDRLERHSGRQFSVRTKVGCRAG
jgi:hypothetical protein